MMIADGNSEASPVTARRAFTKGFSVRLLYGAAGIATVLLVRPDFLGENLHLLVGSVMVYLLVCLAGGTFDAAHKIERRVAWSPRLRLADLWPILLFVFVLILLWQGR